MKIELDAPNLGRREKISVCRAIESGFVSTFGPFVPEFEEKFARYLGVEKAVSLQSGTAALHVSLYELGIGKGDEVIVPALTFIATVNPVLYVGATPVFCDVDRATWNIDPAGIKRSVTRKTKAIIPVHLYGNPCLMAEIRKVARQFNLAVIEDATESLGATYQGQPSGTFGDFGCFSFNGNKIITTGGGGMVVGQDEKKIQHIKFLVNQAREEKNGYYHPEVGFNYRMTNIEASIGLAQLTRLKGFLKKKRKLRQIYKTELKPIKYIRFQEEYPQAKSADWLTVIFFEKKIGLPLLQKKLQAKGIPARRNFIPVPEFPPYDVNAKKNKFPNAYEIYENSLCLPSSTLNSEQAIYRVCKELKSLLTK